ncbi:MAG: aminoacetone oxidase family FAD-binding enzyme [Candidatus Magasanikbacteria bacterium]|nr:aminoacetone oxidase family FAD-binding enzyme [Candidatus Magasanikbacteria bacterium]
MRIAIIGAGAAGMMAAATINEESPESKVFLIEKNDGLGKKVIISGGGRCNVTTGITDLKIVTRKYPRGEKFLMSSMHRFSPQDVRTWFESHGVPLKCEEDLRVFPISNDGRDVVRAFENIFADSNTNILKRCAVQKIERNTANTSFVIHIKDQPEIEAEIVVLSLGGQAYRHTGSTGDGYTLAESLGHHITPLAASLNSFITTETWPATLSGVSFEHATITAELEKEYSFTGPFLFTHRGISGPAVFAMSSIIAFEDYNPQNSLQIFIDLLPDIKTDDLFIQIQNTIKENLKKSFKTILHSYAPRSVIEVIEKEFSLRLEKKSAEISKKEIQAVIAKLKRLPVHAVGRGAGDEFVTAGGVKLEEVNPSTMESLICPNLYFAGEILAIDGFTGGFNLQAAWATGHAAGESIVNKLQ